jgi:DNA-binding NarL/FixJ family response regulator
MGHRIFIVEDHTEFRDGLAELLEETYGLKLCGEASSVREAIRKIERTRPDLVLTDMTLPDGTGLDLIRAIRAKEQELKVLVLSIHDRALYENRVLRAGGDGYVMKQERPEQIVDAIRRALNGMRCQPDGAMNNPRVDSNGHGETGKTKIKNEPECA